MKFIEVVCETNEFITITESRTEISSFFKIKLYVYS